MTSDAPTFAVRAVVFDLDGVLAETEHINVASARHAFANAGLELPTDAESRIVGRHPVDYVPEFAREVGLPASQIEPLLRFQDRRYRELWRTEVRPVAGAIEVVRSLAASGLRLAVATSAGAAHLDACLARFGLDPAFEVRVSKDDVSRRKPDPEAYRTALERLAVPASSALAVEDTSVGVDAARGAGMTVLAVRTEAVAIGSIAHADLVLEDIRAVLDVVTREPIA